MAACSRLDLRYMLDALKQSSKDLPEIRAKAQRYLSPIVIEAEGPRRFLPLFCPFGWKEEMGPHNEQKRGGRRRPKIEKEI